MEYLIRGETLSGIADEVRRLSGTEEALAPDEMKEALAAVETGGSSEALKGMIDGTLTELKATDFEGVASIKPYAFYYQQRLETVDIPDGVTNIEANAFLQCTGLKNLKIPCTISIQSTTSFSNCTNIENLILTPGTGSITTEYDATTIKKVPWYISRANIKSITICDGITKIGNQWFRELSALESMVIPKCVVELGTSAFYSSGLKSITIPKSVTKIGNYCFYDNENLTDVYYEGTEEEWAAIEIGTNNVYITNNIATIHYNTPM